MLIVLLLSYLLEPFVESGFSLLKILLHSVECLWLPLLRLMGGPRLLLVHREKSECALG
jgi:hypothetical protein